MFDYYDNHVQTLLNDLEEVLDGASGSLEDCLEMYTMVLEDIRTIVACLKDEID